MNDATTVHVDMLLHTLELERAVDSAGIVTSLVNTMLGAFYPAQMGLSIHLLRNDTLRFCGTLLWPPKT